MERADCMARFEAFRFLTGFLDTVVVFPVKDESNRQAFTPAGAGCPERKLERDVVLQNMLEWYSDGFLPLPSV